MALKNKDGRSVLVDADRVFSQGRFASSNSTDSGLARSRDSLGSLTVWGIVVWMHLYQNTKEDSTRHQGGGEFRFIIFLYKLVTENTLNNT